MKGEWNEMGKKKISKIAAMHREYGQNEGSICRNCCNFCTHQSESSTSNKCRAYGITDSYDTDWKWNYTGCGLYNTPFNETAGVPLIEKRK